MLPYIEYIVFGSGNSLDKDLFVIVEKLPDTIDECKKTCKYAENILQKDFKEPVNVNIGTIENGIVTTVMKGTEDEVNNSIFSTQHLHKENTNIYITELVERDVERKILRALRMLSVLSRTSHRKEVKHALKSDALVKIEVLKSLDLSQITELGKSNVTWPDYLKTMAFQMGQTLSLMIGFEHYTKDKVSEQFPILKPYLERDINANLYNLNIMKIVFLKYIEREGLTKLKEY